MINFTFSKSEISNLFSKTTFLLLLTISLVLFTITILPVVDEDTTELNELTDLGILEESEVNSFLINSIPVETDSDRFVNEKPGLTGFKPNLLTGGAYTLNFSAANPSDYIPSIPFPGALTAPIGRGNGDPLIPLAEFNDGTSDVKVESLAPQDMALGQIVPFETKITVNGDVTPENGEITFVIGWNTLTTNSGDFGYDARVDDAGYGVIGAFIDTGDGAHLDPGSDATVTGFTWSVINDEIVGVFTVTGLDDGDTVVLETWMVLDDTIPAGIGGNVQSRLIDAATGSDQTITVANSGSISLDNGDAISTGNQTVPLLRPADFFTADVDLSVTKTDDIDPIVQGETLTYTVTASNAGPSVANSVVVYDVLDPSVTFVSASDGGFENIDAGDTIPDGAVQWNIGSLAPGDSVVFTVMVTVNLDAPTGATSNDDDPCGSSDLRNDVTITTISDDINPANDTDCEATDVTPACTLSVTCKNIDPIDLEGCITDIPAPFTDPSAVFEFEACGANVTMDFTASGDEDFCGDGDGVDFTRTYTLYFDGVAQETCPQVIKVQDTTAPVIADAPADITVECIEDIPAMIDLSWTDNCDAGGVVTGSDTTLAPDACGGTITRTWNIADACGNNAITRTQTITVEDTIAPEITEGGSDLILKCDDPTNPDKIDLWLAANGGVVGVDNCSDVTWSDNWSEVSNAFDDSCGAMGSAAVTFTATDDCGNTTPIELNIFVASVDLVKTFAEDSVIAGGVGSTFDLVVTNDGTAPLNNLLIEDQVDDRLTVTGISGADCGTPSQNISCTISALAPGATTTITVSFEVASDVEEANGEEGLGEPGLNDEDTVPNSATVSTEVNNDPNCVIADEADDTIDILVDIDLTIVKTFNPAEVPQGTMQSFTIEVSNNGPSDAVDVSVTDMVDAILDVTNISVTSGTGDCSASDGQDLDCTVQIPTGEAVTITVDYLTAPFLDNSGSPYGTGTGDDFYFVFENGSVLEGSTDGGPIFLDGVDITADVSIVNSLTRNEITFDPPGPDPAFTMHLSCSDPFTGGWGQSAGPVQGIDVNWKIAYFTIARYNPQGFLKSCGNVVNPFVIPNTAFTTGDDSFGTETDEDDAFVEIGPGITIDRLQTKGKRLTVRLNNLVGEDKVIKEVTAIWPETNGNLTKVWLTFDGSSNIVWQGSDDAPNALLDSSVSGWNGGTLFTGEGILRFDFSNKVASSGYVIRVLFTDGTFLDISVDEIGSGRIKGQRTIKVAPDSDTSETRTAITSVRAYPLPFKNDLNLRLNINYEAKVKIEFWDVSGRLVKTFNTENVRPGSNNIRLQIDEGLESAMYILKIHTGKEIVTKNVLFVK